MKFLFVLFAVVVCHAQVPSPLPPRAPVLPDNLDYLVNQTVYQLKGDTRTADVQVEGVKINFASIINVLAQNSRLVDRASLSFERELYNQAVISLDYSTCVGRHQRDLLLVTRVQSQLTACINTANTRGRDLTYSAVNAINMARNNGDTYLRTDTNNCYKNNQPGQNLSNCIHTRINERSRLVQTNLAVAEREVSASYCRAETIGKEAEECIFDVINAFAANIGNVRASIENCIDWRRRNLLECSVTVRNSTLG